MNTDKFLDRICQELINLKEKRPLVEHITNKVTINDCANVTLAIGASPVMADSFDEVEEIVKKSNSLVLNLGGVNDYIYSTMKKAGICANENGIPIVFDPVGVGATEYRKKIAKGLLEDVHADVIKGNASEIKSLAEGYSESKGVDSSISSDDVFDCAVNIANKYRCVCVVTGKIDYITDGNYVIKVYNESDLLSYITGTGCMIASLIGSFIGVSNNSLLSSVAGVMAMSMSGDISSTEKMKRKGIASYKKELFNTIYNLNTDTILKNFKFDIHKIENMYSMYLVTDEKACKGKDFYKCIEESILGGTKIVQLREKELDTRDFYERAKKVKEICDKYNVKFVINDRIDIAQAVDADGVHLGQSDLYIKLAKKILGHNKIIGISAKTMKEAIEAQDNGADYIGTGAMFSTSTKLDASETKFESVKAITDELYIPVLGIGGITADNVEQLEGLGLDGVCVVSDILGNDDCKKRTEEVVNNFRKINNYKNIINKNEM